MDEKFIKEIRGMFESLHERMQENLPFWENEVDTIIANKETDRNRIELTFDYLLDWTEADASIVKEIRHIRRGTC